jgi:hypothetical protein
VLGVEIAQIDDVDGHEAEASMNLPERSLPLGCELAPGCTGIGESR